VLSLTGNVRPAPDVKNLVSTGVRTPEVTDEKAAAPRLRIRSADGETVAVALVLHGGKARSMRPASRRQLSAVRMIPFARALHRAGAAAGLAVWTLQYRDRGWNDKGSQVQDALWALGEIAREHPGIPVYLVGHSLGGRTALAAGGHPSVRAVMALAPWLPASEVVDHLRGTQVLIAHGTRDKWVDPRGSLNFAIRARAAGVDVTRVEVAGVGHAMLRRISLWHGLTTFFVMTQLAGARQSDGPPAESSLRARI
jgi:alpha-beta hydrolase superfamily lysophospholipase